MMTMSPDNNNHSHHINKRPKRCQTTSLVPLVSFFFHFIINLLKHLFLDLTMTTTTISIRAPPTMAAINCSQHGNGCNYKMENNEQQQQDDNEDDQ